MMMLRSCMVLLTLAPTLAAQPSSGSGNNGDSGVVSPFFPGNLVDLQPGGGGQGSVPGDAGVPGGGPDGSQGVPSGLGLRVPGVRSGSGRGFSAMSSGGVRGGSSRPGKPNDYGISDSWQMWWATNKFDFIKLHRIHDAPLTGQGRLLESEAQRQRRLAQIQEVLDGSVLPLLRDLTGSPDPAVRAAAAVALCKLQDVQGTGLVRTLLADKSFDVRRASMLALGISESGRASYQLASIAADANFGRRLLENSALSDEDRGTALISAAIRGQRSSEMILDDLLDNPKAVSNQLLTAACEAAGLARSTRHIGALTSIARSGSQPDYVRSAALTALGRIGDPAVVPTLMAGLELGVEPRRAAAAALGYTAHGGLTSVVSRLITATLDDKDAVTRHFSAITLGRLGGEQAREALKAAFARPSAEMRPWLALALGLCERQSPRGEIPGLLGEKARRESNGETLAAYMIALGLAGGDEAFEILTGYLDDSQVLTASYAALAIGLTEHPDAHPILREALAHSSSPIFQQRAALGLGVLGNSAVVPSLLDLIRDSGNAPVASFAALGIGFLGDENALGPLLQIIQKEGPRGVATTYAISAVGQLFDHDRRPALSRLAAGDNYLARSNAANGLLLLGF